MSLAVDLCCGRGGWTKGLMAVGHRVIGYDIKHSREYPKDALFIQADLRTLNGKLFRDAAVIVASPPCTEFSKWDWDMPFRRSHPKFPHCCNHLELVDACFRIADEAGVPLILENVRGLERWIGAARSHYGPFYLWGDVPAVLPIFGRRRVYKMLYRAPAKRAEIPFELALHIGRCFNPYSAGPLLNPGQFPLDQAEMEFWPVCSVSGSSDM